MLDGSLWTVSPGDITTAAMWMPMDWITSKRADGSLYGYELQNENGRESIRARRDE